ITETFHLQTDDKLSDKELKQIEADDQTIQTILLGLPEEIYAVVDSCETSQEIWLRIQQMMKGSNIGIQEKKAKLFNEWERFTSNEGESIESYYHRFLKSMNDLKRNKHFPEKIASNLKFLNNLQPEWSLHVTIVHQTKDLHTADYTQLYDFLKYNQKEVYELKAERIAKTQDPLAFMANSNNPYAFPAPHQDQSSFNQNYLQQPIQNPKDIKDTTTAMNMALALMAKAFKLNYSTTTKEFHQTQGTGRLLNRNQIGNGNLVAARAEGYAAGQNGNQIRPRRRDAAYLQTQLLIAQKEEAGIQLQEKKYDLMAAATNLDEIKEASSAHQELHKIVRDEIFPIVNQVDARLQNFEIQFLKEAAKFVGDFKSLANEADASLAKHTALELEIERLLKVVVSQDIMIIVQNESVLIHQISKLSINDTSANTKFAKQPIVENLPKLGVDNTKTRRAQPRSNTKHDRSPVIIIRTDNDTDFKNQVLKEYFCTVGISHQMSSVQTPQQNGVVERRNQTLVVAARTLLIFSHAPLFLWAEAIATAYIGKLGAKGDIGFFIGYSVDSYAYRVYNRQTKKIMDTMNVSFDELSVMVFEQRNRNFSSRIKKIGENLARLLFDIILSMQKHYIKADPRVPLILGRSFLRTGRALIDVYEEEITLRVNDESVTFNLNQTMRYSSTYDDNFVNRVDVIDIACEEFVQDVLDFQYNSKSSNPTLVSNPSFSEETKSEFSKEPIVKSSSPTLTPFREKGDILDLEILLNDDPSQLPPMDLKQAEETKAKYSIEEPLELELKELPSHLKYAFLEETDKLPIIIANDLRDVEKEALIKVLKSYKRAIAWKIIDIKVDYLSKWVEAKALPTNDARVVVKFLKSLFYRFGTPRAIISDRGTHFCNDQFARVMIKYGVTHRLATAYHPQTSGQMEVSNRGLKGILERTVGENRASWSDKLDDALWAFHTAFKTPIGCTPYKMVYRKSCHLPIELEHKAYWALKHKKRTKKLHDSRFKNRIFNVGDQVLLINSRLKIFSEKLKTRWSGPFTITQVFPYGTVEMSQPNGPNFKVNGHRVKHYFGGDIPSKDRPTMIEDSRVRSSPLILFSSFYVHDCGNDNSIKWYQEPRFGLEISWWCLSGSGNRPHMLNKENYVPWSSRLLRYAKSRQNGKFIHNSIINGPYVRRMIPEPGDPNREVPVNETFHVQTDDELTKNELK
nr:reverse transcriptase domain-containing protein [Tanacetum cinerariifolium]